MKEKMQRLTVCLTLVIALLLTGCNADKHHYKIGVSQCSHDIWREKQNAELRMGAFFHDNVELCFAAAYDSDERQVQQIDSLLGSGIDLLIVAPNQVQTISPAIDRAYDQGVPVIVFERKTNSQKYTAFMSADNYEMGHQMGDYIVNRLKGQGRVLEVKGLDGSSPAIDRHKGFTDAIAEAPGIDVIATLTGDWTEPTAYAHVRQWLKEHPDDRVDLVFGMNDRSAMGARRAFQEVGATLPLFCGIDGLPDEHGGIRLVRDSVLEASYIYPTHGDKLLQLAVDILEGKPYQKEIKLMSAIVTRDNANVLLMESEEITRQADYLLRLHNKADTYLQRLDTQRMLTWLAVLVIVLLVTAIVLFYRYYIGQVTLRQERVVNTLWDMKPENIPEYAQHPVKPDDQPTSPDNDAPTDAPTNAPTDAPTDATPSAGTTAKADADEAGVQEGAQTSLFITRFKEVVETRLTNSETSVEDLAADMNLSRVQLYRKVKSITGSSPNELLRTARLKRSYQLLLTTELTVSEVAYQVGFTAPSYFTKCFKEEYGTLPGEVRQSP